MFFLARWICEGFDNWDEKQQDKKFKQQLARQIERERKKLEKSNGQASGGKNIKKTQYQCLGEKLLERCITAIKTKTTIKTNGGKK